MPQARFPDAISRPAIRHAQAGTAVANATDYTYYVPTAGAARIRVRIQTTTATGNLLVSPCAPGFKLGPSSVSGTVYTTGASSSTAVAAATEVKVDLDLYGEDYVEIKFSCTLTGTLDFLDSAQV